MPQVNPKTYHLSASSIAAFKACPTRFRLAYREGVRLAEDTDSQRVGTMWHGLHEQYAWAFADLKDDDAAMTATVNWLNERYADRPSYKTDEEWAVEQQQLINCFVGYRWYWQNDPYEVLASEVPFELPLKGPNGRLLPLHRVARVGRIDHVIGWQGHVCSLERKSTSKSIASDSDYWERWHKDPQVSMYALAFREMDKREVLPARYLDDDSVEIGNTLLDVWHKPTIKPSMLTQADTAGFLSDKTHYGQEFEVRVGAAGDVRVNGVCAEVLTGKKGFAIRETPEMYGARLLGDIQIRPEFYFARREIARTDPELEQFEKSLYGIYKAQRAYEREGCWFENESQCRATFPCDYIPICYGPGAGAVCDGSTTPAGFKRIFVDLTVGGSPLDSE